MMLRWVARLVLTCAPVLPTLALAEEPSALPGQPGGDPKPDAEQAAKLVKDGRFEDAIVAARRALQRDERYVPAMLAMAKAYHGLKKYELATAIIDLAQKLQPDNAESYNVLGFIALSRADIAQATANFKKATELQPDYGNAWNTLAALYLQAKNYDPALEAAQNATRLLPKYDKAWLNLGSALRGKNMYVEAEAAYRHALELHADYPDAYFNLGILYLDAPQMTNFDLIGKLGKAVDFLARYKNLAGTRLAKNDPADGYIEDARKGIDREQKRLQRLQKQKEREAAKKPSADAGGGAGPGAPAGKSNSP
ncbi:MAG TPA: tetratricopeptide repeat protein [Polyangia bacterium]|jgi:tetratricopeptide (TPR) repeat protein|nr:tetratricopeptide repeat protein [Polyangia bacterium]